MANLIIVESPTKIRTIKQILGDDYDVAASMGHVRDLPAARLNVDVKNDFEPKYAVIKGKEKLVRDLKSSVGKYDKVFLATDPDREGEAISWHLATLLGMDLNEKNRVTFNEITRTGIEAGMPHQPVRLPEDPPRTLRRPGPERGGPPHCGPRRGNPGLPAGRVLEH